MRHRISTWHERSVAIWCLNLICQQIIHVHVVLRFFLGGVWEVNIFQFYQLFEIFANQANFKSPWNTTILGRGATGLCPQKTDSWNSMDFPQAFGSGGFRCGAFRVGGGSGDTLFRMAAKTVRCWKTTPPTVYPEYTQKIPTRYEVYVGLIIPGYLGTIPPGTIQRPILHFYSKY